MKNFNSNPPALASQTILISRLQRENASLRNKLALFHTEQRQTEELKTVLRDRLTPLKLIATHLHDVFTLLEQCLSNNSSKPTSELMFMEKKPLSTIIETVDEEGQDEPSRLTTAPSIEKLPLVRSTDENSVPVFVPTSQNKKRAMRKYSTFNNSVNNVTNNKKRAMPLTPRSVNSLYNVSSLAIDEKLGKPMQQKQADVDDDPADIYVPHTPPPRKKGK